jgi:probable F420-dependent oxidoreductase
MKVRLGLGLTGLPLPDAAAFWQFVERCEASEVDSLWQSDRLVSPYAHLEAMSVMAALAGGTRRLKFGMNVVVLPLRDPLVLAKECASIDFLSGGRFLPAFGVGPDQSPEWKVTGRDPSGRGRQSDECLAIMTQLWRGERVTHAGAHYRYTDARINPLPVQQPLPVWIGGSSKAAVRRTAQFGTGWLGGIQTPEQVAPVVTALKAASLAAGRPLDPDHFGATFSCRFGSWDDPVVQANGRILQALAPGSDAHRLAAVGDATAIVARLREFVAAGCSKFVIRLMAVDADDLTAQLDRLCAEVVPLAHVPGFAAESA